MKINGIRVHASITADRLMQTIEDADLGNPGLCILCGVDHEGVEPDAEKYYCDSCGSDCVYGAESLLLAIA